MSPGDSRGVGKSGSVSLPAASASSAAPAAPTAPAAEASELELALLSLVKDCPVEFFLDYLAVSAPVPQKMAGLDNRAGLELQHHDMALYSVQRAARACAKMDVPFFAPADFRAEMFRAPDVMARVQKRQEVEEQERRERLERRRAKMVSKGAKQAQHESSVVRARTQRQEREIIARWKEERAALRKKGADEASMPTLEQVQAQYAQEQRKRRHAKDVKYSGRKTIGKTYKELKRNTRKSTRKDDYRHRQFSGLPKNFVERAQTRQSKQSK